MERETSLEERLRHDKEKADANAARRLRLGGVSALVEEEKPTSKSPAKAKPKTSAKAKPKTTRSRAKATSKKK